MIIVKRITEAFYSSHSRSHLLHPLFTSFYTHLLLEYLILYNFDGVDSFLVLILLPRVLVEPLAQLLNRLVQFPVGGSVISWTKAM